MNNYDPQPKNNKPKYKGKYRVDSTRLPAWSYATSGKYFLTICTDGRKCFFGEVVGGEMQLSQVGEIAQELWCEIPKHFSNCDIDVFCIMPNHIHGILIINPTPDALAREAIVTEDAIDLQDAVDLQDANRSDAMNRVSTRGGHQRGGVTGVFNPMLSKNSISKIVRWYKGRCTFEINQIYQGFGWQERFHDEIIRDELALDRIRQYIINNPRNWQCDREQPSR
ncbi:MAG: transposase [Tolypothrix brevis GSE-NOS-MK-07-07A]|jgi:REP element-mobilizing transposase RayT|nr:transposase [Tolypothrix brevis GSE-NOS-MK-07-07A]